VVINDDAGEAWRLHTPLLHAEDQAYYQLGIYVVFALGRGLERVFTKGDGHSIQGLACSPRPDKNGRTVVTES